MLSEAKRPTGATSSPIARRAAPARRPAQRPATAKPPATAKRPATAQRRRDLFLEAAAIIDAEYDDRVALDDVAHRVATSRRQLQRAFAEAGETSFRAYLQRARMDRAAELLSDPRTSVSAVASAVGYRQAAQFAKAFRRHHGVPPSSFRATAAAPLAATRALAA